MSETIEAPPETPQPTPEPAPEPQATETPVPEQTAPEAAPEPAPRSKQADRRYAAITAQLRFEAQRATDAERRAAAAEELLRAANPDAAPRQTVPQVDVETRAQQLLAERAFNAKLQAVKLAGDKEFGTEGWNEKTTYLQNMGAQTPEFLHALVELPNAARIVSVLADDPDTLTDLLAKSPTAMAAALGRMDAKMENDAAPKPAARVSAAPRPPVPIQQGAVLREVDPFGADQEKLSMAEWNAAFEKSDLGKKMLRRRW